MGRQKLEHFKHVSKNYRVMCIHTSVNSGNGLLKMHVVVINGYLPNVQESWKWNRRLQWTNDCDRLREVDSQKTYSLSSILVSNCLRLYFYHCLWVDKPSVMIVWLHKKGVVCDEILCKNYRYQLILPLKPTLITNHIHAVVHLPSYICEQNPIEFAYARLEKSPYKLHHSRYEPILTVSVPFCSISYINTQSYFSIFRYTLWYLIDLTNSTFYLVFKDLCKMPDDDWYQSQHIALKRNVLCWTLFCFYEMWTSKNYYRWSDWATLSFAIIRGGFNMN
jgi:transposase